MSATTQNLEDRVAALEEQLANALADNLQPNVLKVDLDGRIAALLSGGVETTEDVGGTGLPDPSHGFSWIDANGDTQEFLWGRFDGTRHRLFAAAGTWILELIDDTGASAFLQASKDLSDLQSVPSALANLGIAFGTVDVAWPGGTGISSTSNIAHGLGRPAKATILTPSDQSDGNATSSMRVITRNGNPSQGLLIVNYNPVAGVKNTCSWVAIG